MYWDVYSGLLVVCSKPCRDGHILHFKPHRHWSSLTAGCLGVDSVSFWRNQGISDFNQNILSSSQLPRFIISVSVTTPIVTLIAIIIYILFPVIAVLFRKYKVVSTLILLTCFALLRKVKSKLRLNI
jgi:hypothetical protein